MPHILAPHNCGSVQAPRPPGKRRPGQGRPNGMGIPPGAAPAAPDGFPSPAADRAGHSRPHQLCALATAPQAAFPLVIQSCLVGPAASTAVAVLALRRPQLYLATRTSLLAMIKVLRFSTVGALTRAYPHTAQPGSSSGDGLAAPATKVRLWPRRWHPTCWCTHSAVRHSCGPRSTCGYQRLIRRRSGPPRAPLV